MPPKCCSRWKLRRDPRGQMAPPRSPACNPSPPCRSNPPSLGLAEDRLGEGLRAILLCWRHNPAMLCKFVNERLSKQKTGSR